MWQRSCRDGIVGDFASLRGPGGPSGRHSLDRGPVVGVVVLCELTGLRYIPNNRVGIVEKLWSVRGSVTEGRIIALNGEAGFPGRGPPRRLALRPLALAVPDPPRAAGDRASGQDRLRLRPGRRAAGAQPDARPRGCLQQLPGRPGFLVGRAGQSRPSRPSASAAVSGRSCAKAFTPSTSALFVVITEDKVYRLDSAASASSRRWSAGRTS